MQNSQNTSLPGTRVNKALVREVHPKLIADSSPIHRRFIAVCFPGLTMKVLIEGLFVVAVLLLELVGMIVLARHVLTTETYLLASRDAAPTTYIVTSDDDYDRGSYWVEWEDPACSMWGVPAEGDTKYFRVNRSGKEAVGIGEAAGCRGKLRPHVATTRQPGVGPSGGH